MYRRTFLLGSAALAAVAASPAAATPIPLNALSNYINGLKTVESPFTQVNDDGTISTGTVFIRRPGRMRFEYNAPENLLVLASGGQVAIFDGRSNTARPEQYPLARTPLNLILEANVNLAAAGMVVGHRQDGAKTLVLAQDPKRPELGTIELVFTADPTELRQWIVTDDSGARTTVILGALTKGRSYPASTFAIQSEITRRGG